MVYGRRTLYDYYIFYEDGTYYYELGDGADKGNWIYEDGKLSLNSAFSSIGDRGLNIIFKDNNMRTENRFSGFIEYYNKEIRE